MVKVIPLRDVVIPGGARLARGVPAEVDARLLDDLVRGGYVEVVDGQESAQVDALETAVIEPEEKAVRPRGKKRKGGEL